MSEESEATLSGVVLGTASREMVSRVGDIEVKYIRLLYRGVGADRAKSCGSKEGQMCVGRLKSVDGMRVCRNCFCWILRRWVGKSE